MRYTLWSQGRLIGHTDLDIHTVSPSLRQGFIEPTDGADSVLRDATGVPRAIAATRRMRREGVAARTRDELFAAAYNRREALDLQLRDENGAEFECDFMRVWDLPALDCTDDMEDEADVADSCATDDQLTSDKPWSDDLESDIELIDEWIEDRENEEVYHSAWPPPPPPDDRWNTMRYLLQVFLKTSGEEEDPLFFSPPFG